jgi:hypothetical protein
MLFQPPVPPLPLAMPDFQCKIGNTRLNYWWRIKDEYKWLTSQKLSGQTRRGILYVAAQKLALAANIAMPKFSQNASAAYQDIPTNKDSI